MLLQNPAIPLALPQLLGPDPANPNLVRWRFPPGQYRIIVPAGMFIPIYASTEIIIMLPIAVQPEHITSVDDPAPEQTINIYRSMQVLVNPHINFPQEQKTALLNLVASYYSAQPSLVNYQNPIFGFTLTHDAATYGNNNMLKFFLTYGVDLSLRDYFEQTAAERARSFGHHETAAALDAAANQQRLLSLVLANRQKAKARTECRIPDSLWGYFSNEFL